MSTNMKLGLGLGYLKAVPLGLQHCWLKRTGEHFSLSRPTSHVKNLIFGTMYIEQVGEMKILNYKTGEVCVINFVAEGWSGKNKHLLEGFCYNSMEDALSKKKTATHRLSGTWTGRISWQPMRADGTDVD